jgi:hypothetical protein
VGCLLAGFHLHIFTFWVWLVVKIMGNVAIALLILQLLAIGTSVTAENGFLVFSVIAVAK